MAFMEPEFYESKGMPVARGGNVARRVAAFIGIVAILIVTLVAMWAIYEHHHSAAPREEPTIVELASRAG